MDILKFNFMHLLFKNSKNYRVLKCGTIKLYNLNYLICTDSKEHYIMFNLQKAMKI